MLPFGQTGRIMHPVARKGAYYLMPDRVWGSITIEDFI